MIEVVPAILPQSFADIEHDVARVAGIAARVQIDIVDGKVAPKATWPYINDDQEIFAKLIAEEKGLPHWDKVEYELDMMIEGAHTVAEQWIDAGISTLIPHREATSDEELEYIMKVARSRGAGFGLAVLPSTATHTFERWFKDADFIQVMGSTKIGQHGMPLEDRAIVHIEDIRRACPNCVIAVDIGVNRETAPRLVRAGVTKLVAGSAIWESDDPAAAIHELQNIS